MPSKIKDICNAINREQKQTIKDFTSGHLNENHLYRPISLENGRRKAIWPTSTKPYPTMRPYHRLEINSSKVEQMKESLLEFAYLSLPELPQKRIATNRLKSNETRSKSTLTDESLPKISVDSIEVPSFSIGLSEEQRMNKMKSFNENVLQKSDAYLHGLGYAEDFVDFIERDLRLKLESIDAQQKNQSLSLNRLQAFSEAMSQLIEGSFAFGPVLERIRTEYEFYLEYLLASQPEYGSHIAEQLKRLRQAQPNFSAADSELFDINRIETETKYALEKNCRLNKELEQIKQEKIEKQKKETVLLVNVPVVSTELKMKTQAEQIDDMRENIFELLDRMNRKKQEIAENFVPTSVCTQLQQAIRDTEMDIVKTKTQNETLINEINLMEKRIREKIFSHDQSEFAEENVDQIIQLLKKIDLLHMKHSTLNKKHDDDQYFLHTYDDYFS